MKMKTVSWNLVQELTDALVNARDQLVRHGATPGPEVFNALDKAFKALGEREDELKWLQIAWEKYRSSARCTF